MKIFIVMTVVGFVWSKTQIYCPNKCICDKWTNLKRVKCSDQNLMNIGEDIPSSVEILDISYNQISELFENEFGNLGLTSIKLLNISHNKVGHMHLNAFENSDKLRVIDLSFNIIEYILQDWFYDLPNLKELYMGNNNFFKYSIDGPLLESNSLEILDFSYCKITHLKPGAFSSLPKLKTLQLDGNFLIEINTFAIKGMGNLQSITVTENPFNCGEVMTELKRYLRANNVRYVDPCTKKKPITIERSQKMITLEDAVQENNLWMYDDEENANDNTTICNCTKAEKEQGILMEIIEISPILTIVISLVTGIMLGLLIACNIQIKPSKLSVRRRPKRYSVIRRTYMENSDPLVLNCENIYESTPIPQRRMEMYQL